MSVTATMTAQPTTTDRLEGELTFARVPQWLARADALAAAGTLDLATVTRADSAGLALLLELKRRAARRGATLHYAQAPEQLIALAEFFGLRDVLKLGT